METERCWPFQWVGVLVGLALVLALPAAVPAADPVKIGPEIWVTDDPEDGAYNPRIAADPAGNFVVAWEGRARAFWSSGIPRGPSFATIEPQFFVTSSGAIVDEFQSIAADRAGNFIVAYNARTRFDYVPAEPACDVKSCIMTKRYESTGVLSSATFVVGDPRLFPYNNDYNQTANPEITADGKGNFVVAWEGIDLGPYGYAEDEGVWARKLVSVGQVNGAQFKVNEQTYGYQGDYGALDVAADDAGNFVVVWEDRNEFLPPYGGIIFQRFDESKNPVGPTFRVGPELEGDDPQVAQLPSGGFMVVWEDYTDVNGRAFDATGAPFGPEFTVAEDASGPKITASRAGSFVVVFKNESLIDGIGGRTFDATGTATSNRFRVDTAMPSAWRPAVAAADDGNFIATWNNGGEAYAQRFQVAPPTQQQVPVLGKVAILTNKNPDDFFKSAGKWKASGDDIVSPLRGSSSDPRCNGEPEGTVKASVRFYSATSGQDVTIDLPCQNWKAIGGNKVSSVAKRGYKYSDGKREDGPCNSVKITGTKSVSVSCKGKPGAASFDYDLQSGVDQGPLATVLQLGLFEYCAEFQPFFNGSDGKKYKGKALAAPVACP